MSFEINTLSDLDAAAFDTIIDVRSPAEYEEDHIPGAISLPVLSNDERAHVGTIYKQESPFLARKIGAALVARNAARHIEDALSGFDGDWRPLVYCWRGGQRSGSFSTILKQIGWRVETLSGGYQSYRKRVVELLYDDPFPVSVILLDGNTGTGKTNVLQRLISLGVQAIDLEGLANHRGSVLGNVGEQPSQKRFETKLAVAVQKLDQTRPLVLEAESSRIGHLNLPPRLFAAMRKAPRILLDAPLTARAEFLKQAYFDELEDAESFKSRIDGLIKLQGRERVEAWKLALDQGELASLAKDLMVRHYDPRYEKAREREDIKILDRVFSEKLDDAGLDGLAKRVAQTVMKASEGPPPSQCTVR